MGARFAATVNHHGGDGLGEYVAEPWSANYIISGEGHGIQLKFSDVISFSNYWQLRPGAQPHLQLFRRKTATLQDRARAVASRVGRGWLIVINTKTTEISIASLTHEKAKIC
jgi:hypothetical protein